MHGKRGAVDKSQVVTITPAGYPQIEVDNVHFFNGLTTTISSMALAS
jgi:hypothetical protein